MGTRWLLGRLGEKAGLLIFGLALGLAGGEVLARLVWRPEKVPERPAPRKPPRPDLKELRTVWDLARPNTEGLLSTGRYYRTNSFGFRGPEYPETPPPGVFRIVVTGDSVTMGAGIEEEDVYATRLQVLLNRNARGKAYEVLNLGLAGMSANHAVDRLEGIGLRFHPQMVIYGVTINDIEGPFYVKSAMREVLDRQGRVLHLFDNSPSYLLRAVWPRVIGSVYALYPQRGTYVHEALHNWLRNPRAWGWFEHQLDRFRLLAARRSICGVVFIHPVLTHLNALHPFRPVYARIREAAERRGLFVVEAWDRVKGLRDRSLWVSAFDSHPNERGHELFAEALWNGLQNLPERCWKTPRRDRLGLVGGDGS